MATNRPPAAAPRDPAAPLLAASALWRLAQLGQEGSRLLEEALRPENLRWRDYAVLAVLEENGSIAQNRIGQLLGVDRSSMVGLIDGLENRGLVSRERSATDRRAYAVVLTDEGRRLIGEVLRPLSAQVQDGLLHGLDEHERALLSTLLGKAAAAARSQPAARR